MPRNKRELLLHSVAATFQLGLQGLPTLNPNFAFHCGFLRLAAAPTVFFGLIGMF